MKGLKDFLYDKNDILIAFAILVIAALLIVWRMNAIMEYPQTLAEEAGVTDTTEDSAVDAEKDAEKEAAAAEKETESGNGADDPSGEGTSSLWNNGALSKDVTVTVQGGSATAAVQSLIDAGLFQSYDEYSQVCKAAGYTPENIKATTFTFTAGSTQTDIAEQVTR